MNKQTDFKFRVYNPRYQHDDVYTIKFTDNGWFVNHIAINGLCNTDGSPVLYQNFKQDSISYPESMKSDMEYLWEQYHANNLKGKEVQDILDKIGIWVNKTTEARPNLWD